MPALLTRIEMLPALAISAAAAWHAARSVTSSFFAEALPPADAIR